MTRDADGIIIDASPEETQTALTDHHAALQGLAQLVWSYHTHEGQGDPVLLGLRVFLERLATDANDHATMVELCFMKRRGAKGATR